ncbi:MAG: hypothetical protein ACP5OX_01175 [Minisyncoccia bacterium]
MNYKIKQEFKGQIFLMSLLILGAVLILALILLSILTKDLRQAIETAESVKAFYAADSCMEWQLYNSFSSQAIQEKPQMTNNTDCEYQNTFEINGQIQTIGISRKVKRGLEINF